jgi:outer membrane autotransporter protein
VFGAVLFASVMGAGGALAQDATWLTNPADGNFNSGANWNPASVPTGRATFSSSNTTLITNVGGALAEILFDATAPAYTLKVDNSVLGLNGGGGIVNNSSQAQTIALTNAGRIGLGNGTTLGNVVVTFGDNTQNKVEFLGTASGGTAGISSLPGGFGTVDLTGLSSGGTTVGSLDGNISVNLGNRQLDIGGNNASGTLAGAIQGAGGSIVKSGTGTLTLTGAAGYTGGTTINAGTLQVGDGGTTGNLGSGTVVNNSRLTFNRADDIAVGNTISGSGNLLHIGSGTLTLTGTNSYTGSTGITLGTLAVSADSNLGNGGGLFLSGGTLKFLAGFELDSNRVVRLVNAANAAIDTNGFDTTISQGIGSIISLGHLAKLGAGTLTLGSTIDVIELTAREGTVRLAANASITSGGITGQGGTVDLNGTNQTISFLLGSSGTIALGGGSLTVQSGDFGGAITGTGSLITQGPLTLRGSNTYTGGTTVSGGTLQGSTTSLQGNIVNNATVGFGQGSTGTYSGAISGPGNVTVDVGGFPINAVNFTGTNSYSGSTTINTGTLQIGDGGTTGSLGSGAVVNNSRLAFNRADDITVANIISGSGTLLHFGKGTLTLTGTNTYTGSTSIAGGGTLAISADSNLGNGGAVVWNGGTLKFLAGFDLDSNRQIRLVNAANAVIDTNGFDTTISQGIGSVISPGHLTKRGAGTLTLGGTIDLFELTAEAGTVRLAPNASITSGGITGRGGTVDLNGTNQSVQFLLGSSGTIALGAGSLTTEGGGDFGGTITGSGGLTTQERLTLRGSNTYTGLTTVAAGGLLRLSGSVAGDVLVQGGGTQSGIGTIGGGLMNQGTVTPGNHGIITPGFAIGTLTVAGNYSQTAGSTYVAEVNAAGQSDLIKVGGNAALAGTVSVQAEAGIYKRLTSYTILGAGGTIGGTYGTVTSNQPRLVPTLSRIGNTVTLTLTNLDATYNSPNFSGNQNAVANLLNQANAGATGDFANVLNAISNLDSGTAARVLDAIGGQNYSGFSTASVLSALTFMNNFQGQAGGGQAFGNTAATPGRTYTNLAGACDDACDSASPARWGVWGGGVGAFGTVAGDSNSYGITYNLGGFAAGIDRKFGNNFMAGFATGFTAASLYTQGMPGYGTSNTLQFALYGEYADGPVYLDALAGYAHADNRQNRPIVIPGLPYRAAQGYATANQFFGQLEAGYRLDVAPRLGGFVTPFVRLQGSTSTQNGFSETGADSLNLTVARQTTDSLRTVLGAQLGAGIDAGWYGKLNVLFRAGWSHEYADLTRPVTASFAGAPALAFTTAGASAPRDGVVLGLGLNTALNEQTNLYFRYDGNLAGGNTNHTLSAGLRFVW